MMAGKSGSIRSRTKADRRKKFAERQRAAKGYADGGMKETAALASRKSYERARAADQAALFAGYGSTGLGQISRYAHRAGLGLEPGKKK